MSRFLRLDVFHCLSAAWAWGLGSSVRSGDQSKASAGCNASSLAAAGHAKARAKITRRPVRAPSSSLSIDDFRRVPGRGMRHSKDMLSAGKSVGRPAVEDCDSD